MNLYLGMFCLGIVVFLIYCRASLRVWTYFLGLWLVVLAVVYSFSGWECFLLAVFYFAVAIVFNIKKIRANLFSKWIFLNKEDAPAEDAIFQDYFEIKHTHLKENNLKNFDALLFWRLGNFFNNLFIGGFLNLTSGYLSSVPFSKLKRYSQQFNRLFVSFSLLVDAISFFRVKKEKKEEVIVLLREIFNLIFLGEVLLKYITEKGQDKERMSVASWIFPSLLFCVQEKMLKVLRAFQKKGVIFFLKKIIFPYGPRFKNPGYSLSQYVINKMLLSNDLSAAEGEKLFERVETYFDLFSKVSYLDRRLKKASESGEIAGEACVQRVTAAIAAGLISQEEGVLLLEMDDFRRKQDEL